MAGLSFGFLNVFQHHLVSKSNSPFGVWDIQSAVNHLFLSDCLTFLLGLGPTFLLGPTTSYSFLLTS